MMGHFTDRRRAAALLLHGIRLREEQLQEWATKSECDSTTGAIHQAGMSVVITEAADAGEIADLALQLVGLVLDVEPQIALRADMIESEARVSAGLAESGDM